MICYSEFLGNFFLPENTTVIYLAKRLIRKPGYSSM